MDKSEENDIKIANYLEHKMTVEEEESFMNELVVNDDLQEQFEEALFVHSLLSKDGEKSILFDDQMLQPADDHINMIETALINVKQKNGKDSIIRKFGNYKNVAAVLSIIIAGIVVYLLGIRKTVQKGNVVETGRQVIIGPKTVSTNDSSLQAIALNINSETIFKKFYRPYSSEDDPVEISKYYIDYKRGMFDEIISVKEADYMVKGSNENAAFIKQYMQLYKGLSYLAKNNAIEANRQFDTVLESTNIGDPLYFKVQWYQTLALVKINDLEKAKSVASKISKSRSPYRLKANLLIKELK